MRWPVALLCLTACQAPLDVDLYGRRFLIRGPDTPIPSFDRGRLPILRLKGEPEAIEVTFDGHPLPIETTSEAGYTWVHVRSATLPPKLGALEVAAARHRSAERPIHWTLSPEEMPLIRSALAAKRAARFDEAEAWLAKGVIDEDRWVRMWARIERGRVALADGEPVQAAIRWEKAADGARQDGFLGEAIIRLTTASFAMRRAHRYQSALRLIERAEQAAAHTEDGRVNAAIEYQRGLLALELGDQRLAERSLRRAAEIVRSYPLAVARTYERGPAYQRLRVGRFGDAVTLFEQANADDGEVRPQDLNALADARTKAYRAEALPADWDRARAELLRALTLTAGRPDRWRTALIRCNLGIVALESGQLEEAQTQFSTAERLHPPLFSRTEECSLEKAELALALKDRATALVALAPFLDGRGLIDPGLEERAQHLRARVAATFDEPDAGRFFETALERTIANARRMSIQSDRTSFFASRRRFFDDYVSWLVAQGASARAATVADAAQTLLLADVDAGTRLSRLSGRDWPEWTRRLERYHMLRARLPKEKKACDQKPSADQAECRAQVKKTEAEIRESVDLTFALLDERAPLHAVDLVDPEAVQARMAPDERAILVRGSHSFLLGRDAVEDVAGPPPLERWISPAVKRVFVVGVDLGVANRGGTPLAAQVELSHLPALRFLLDRPGVPDGETLIVGDPTTDLRGARTEARWLSEKGGRLLIGKAASRARVLAELSNATTFHFAGHARVAPRDPWSAHLVLNDGILTLEDLLIARPRVGVAVLSACATAGEEETDGPIGLPAAFLLSGAQAVLATVRPLEDAEALEFIREFYARGGAERPLAAVRAAVQDRVKAGDPSWRAFRLFGR